jgi:glycosyltransferase involved in cell wall biosynthesis
VPSLQDQSLIVLLEEMAYCIPVIATNVGAIPQIIQNGVNGLLIPPAQPEAINTMIKRVISDNELRHRLIQKGFEYASAHTVEKETTRIMQIVSVYFRDEVLDND